MLEAETEAGAYWEQCGREALAHNVKGIIIMVRHRSLTRVSLSSRIMQLSSFFATINPPLGRSLGLSRRQDRSCHKSQPYQGFLPVRESRALQGLETKPGRGHGGTMHVHARG